MSNVEAFFVVLILHRTNEKKTIESISFHVYQLSREKDQPFLNLII